MWVSQCAYWGTQLATINCLNKYLYVGYGFCMRTWAWEWFAVALKPNTHFFWWDTGIPYFTDYNLARIYQIQRIRYGRIILPGLTHDEPRNTWPKECLGNPLTFNTVIFLIVWPKTVWTAWASAKTGSWIRHEAEVCDIRITRSDGRLLSGNKSVLCSTFVVLPLILAKRHFHKIHILTEVLQGAKQNYRN